MTDNMIRLRLRSLKDSTFLERNGTTKPTAAWLDWYYTCERMIQEGAEDSELPPMPKR